MSITKRYSLWKTMSAYCVINLLADLNEQVIIKKRTAENYRYAKTARITLVGTCIIGPIAFFWMRLAEIILPGTGVRTVVKKVLIDQSLVGPFSISSFYISTNILEGKSDIFEEWRQKFLKTWKTGLMFWPVAQGINFSLVPHQHRTSLFMPVCSFMWTTYLCYMKEQEIKKTPEEVQKTPDEPNTS